MNFEDIEWDTLKKKSVLVINIENHILTHLQKTIYSYMAISQINDLPKLIVSILIEDIGVPEWAFPNLFKVTSKAFIRDIRELFKINGYSTKNKDLEDENDEDFTRGLISLF